VCAVLAFTVAVLALPFDAQARRERALAE